MTSVPSRAVAAPPSAGDYVPTDLSDEEWSELERLLGAAKISSKSREAINQARQLYADRTYFRLLNHSHRAALHRDTGLARQYRKQLRDLLKTWHEAGQDPGARKLIEEMSDQIKVMSHGRLDLIELMTQLITTNVLIGAHAENVRHRRPSNPRHAFIRAAADAFEQDGLKVSARGDVDAYGRASPFVYAVKLLMEQVDEALAVTDGPQELTSWSDLIATELGQRRKTMGIGPIVR